MNIKIAAALVAATLSTTISASAVSPSMEKAISACRDLSQAINTASVSALRAANKTLKEADIVDFGDIALSKGKETDINGHFVFDEEFVDSLIVNREVITFSRQFAEKRTGRGSTGVKGRVKMTTKALKAGQTAVWKTVNAGDAEFALVSEPGGLFTMTIKDKNGKVLYAEPTDNKKGAPVRMAGISLPTGKMTHVLIEITNHGKTDASFALLKN